MATEAIMIAMDNSESVRENSAAILKDQIRAIEFFCRAILDENKSIVGLSTIAENPSSVLIDPTSDIRVILDATRERRLPVGGRLDFDTGIRLATLGFVHIPKRMRKRMLIFVGGPVSIFKHHAVELGSFFKENGVAVDVISFVRHYNKDHYEEVWKKDKLDIFFGAANNNNNSHIVYVEPGFSVRDVLSSLSTTVASRPMDAEERVRQTNLKKKNLKNKAVAENVEPRGVEKKK